VKTFLFFKNYNLTTMAANPEKVAKAKMIILVIGIITIIMAFIMESILQGIMPMMESMGMEDLITDQLVLIMTILYIIGGAMMIIGALMLQSNFKVGKMLIILACIPTIKDIGILVLIIALVMLKDEKPKE
jgi:hypothetical protein